MSAVLLDGKKISADVYEKQIEEVKKLKEIGIVPGLAVILVGEDPASQVYVKNKENACKNTGVYSKSFRLSTDITQQELEDLVDDLNEDDKFNGILIQLPLPKHLDEEKALLKIKPEKDVDGFHIVNNGKLMRGQKCTVACTPKGIIRMLETSGIQIEGKHAVIIGRSNLVGKPVALLLLQKNATVTICHSKTKNISDITKQADILIVATGRPKMVKANMVKKGAVVVDVGITRMEDGSLAGDVDFDSVKEVASYITPVPGGVGRMTVAMLLQNTIEAAQNN